MPGLTLFSLIPAINPGYTSLVIPGYSQVYTSLGVIPGYTWFIRGLRQLFLVIPGYLRVNVSYSCSNPR